MMKNIVLTIMGSKSDLKDRIRSSGCQNSASQNSRALEVLAVHDSRVAEVEVSCRDWVRTAFTSAASAACPAINLENVRWQRTTMRKPFAQSLLGKPLQTTSGKLTGP